MRKQIQLWGSRTLAVALVVVAAHRWGPPLYTQYFVQKKAAIYVPTAKVSEGPFVVSFHEIGTLKAERSVPITSDVDGKIVYLLPEGRVVKAGDKIAEIDTTQMRREIRNKQLALTNAEAEVQRVKAELDILREENKTKVAQAEATLEFNEAERDAAREQSESKASLAKDKLIPRTEAEQAAINLRAKELEVKKGRMSLVLQNKDVQSKESQKEADVRTKEYARNISKYDLEDMQNRIKSAQVKAPASGMVVLASIWSPDGRRKIKEGDEPWRGQLIGSLPDLSSMQASVSVGEADAPKLKEGLPVVVRLEAVKGKRFHGTVKEISPLASERDPFEGGGTPGKKNFEVTVQIKEVDPKSLKPGMTTDAEFIVERIERATYVPIESVIEKDGETWVFVRAGKGEKTKYRRVTVKTGEYNDNFVCIKKGLKKGDVVALRDPTKPLDRQEAGSSAPGADEEKTSKTKQPPLPAAVKK